MVSNEENLTKIVLNGPSKGGKTKILRQYTESQFSDVYRVTIWVEFKTKEVAFGQNKLKIQICDTAGSETFRAQTQPYLKGANVIFFVFDLTSESSFNEVDNFLTEAREIEPNALYFLLGNKLDLANVRIVSYEVANSYAQKNGLTYQEVSAKTGEGLQSCFELVVQKLVNKDQSQTESKSKVFTQEQSKENNQSFNIQI